MRISTIIIVLLVFMGAKSFAKDFEGVVTYNIEVVHTSVDASMSPQMIPDQIVAYIKDSKLRIEAETLMKVTFLSDSKNQTAHTLIDMFGLKYALEMDSEEIQKGKKSSSRIRVNATSEYKTIAGQKCKKLVITDTTNDKKIEVYCAPKLEVDNLFGVGLDFADHVEGLPLDFTIVTGGLTLHVQGTQVKPATLSSSKFVVPSDYEKAEADQFLKLLGM